MAMGFFRVGGEEPGGFDERPAFRPTALGEGGPPWRDPWDPVGSFWGGGCFTGKVTVAWIFNSTPLPLSGNGGW